MNFKSVKLVNFNNYENSKFTFEPGFNIIELPNGGGKTTLIEGISFALYGARILESGAKSYIREGSSGPSLVKLLGHFQGDDFDLTRHVSPSRVTFTWGTVQISRVEELTQFWKAHLLPASLFKATICCNQREAALLAQAPSAQRRKLISELLRFDAVTNAINVLSSHQKSVRTVSEEQIEQVSKELSDFDVVDESQESFHQEQLWLLTQEANENKEIEEKRKELTHQLQELSALVDLLFKASSTSSQKCPICNSTKFDVQKVKAKLAQNTQQLQQLRAELSSLPTSTSLTEHQRSKIQREFTIEQHRSMLTLIKRKKELLSSLATLKTLYEQSQKSQTYVQARKLLRDFLDSTTIPLLNSVSKLTTELLQGSGFGEFTLNSSFEIKVDGRPFNKYSMGQRDFIAVMFRIAISYVASSIYGVDQFPLLLDSIGDSLDSPNFSLMMTIFSSEAVKLFPQLILTTHHS